MKRLIQVFAVGLVTLLVLGACDSGTATDNSDNKDVETEVGTEEVADEPTQNGNDDEADNGEGNSDVADKPMQWSNPPEMQLEDGTDYRAVIETNKGSIQVNLLQDDAPTTVNNFVFLAEQGYYTDVPFHRVIKDFMIQTGDPTGTGAGGPGYRFEDEPVVGDYKPGTLAMANAGPNTNGSQFFIMHGDLSGRLPKNYTIFGEVVEGMDVVDAIANTPVQASAQGEMSSPKEPLSIQSVQIEKQ